ncbi:hypothetical protein ACEPAG_866 [Sanghuangporus baumii]
MAAPAPYAAYMYASAPPGQNAAVYGVPPQLVPHQLSHSQSSRYDPALPPPPPLNAYHMSQINGPPVITPDARQPAPRPRRFMDDRTASDPVKKPLKSALKKTGASGSGAGPNGNLHRSRTVPAVDPDGYRGREMRPTASSLSRGQSVSGSERPARATSVSRVRSRSRSRHRFTPAHLILSLSGTCRMNLSSVIFQETVDNIRERVLTMWPDGVILQTYRDESNEFVIQFSGNPWTAKSSLESIAMKMILELFAVLARQGYACTSTIDTGHAVSSPRLVFTRGQPDPSAEFAMMVFSNSRRKVKLINHAPAFCDSLTSALRDSFPHKIRRSSWDESDMYAFIGFRTYQSLLFYAVFSYDRYVIEMSNYDFSNITDLVIAVILEHAAASGLKLEGSIPLSHSGFWSFLQGRKELWIFRRLTL